MCNHISATYQNLKKKAWNTELFIFAYLPPSASDNEQHTEGAHIVVEMSKRMQMSALWF